MQDMRIFPLADHIRVTRDGHVESCLRPGCKGGKGDVWRPVKINRDAPGGYPTVGIKMRGKHRTIGVHRVVAYAWLGPPPAPGMVVRHLDDDRQNYRLDNLSWGTQEDNTRDAIRNGRTPRGERNGNSKLSDFDRWFIRAGVNTGLDRKFMAEHFGVCGPTIHYVVKGRKRNKERMAALMGEPIEAEEPQEVEAPKGEAKEPFRRRGMRMPKPRPQPPSEAMLAYRAIRPGRGRRSKYLMQVLEPFDYQGR